MRDYKVYSYTILHYGLSYLPWALKSIYDSVDRMYIFHTDHPSHGHKTDIPPIETREELKHAVFASFGGELGGKTTWLETDIWNEGQQRDYAVAVCQHEGADLILVVDYDEIHHGYVLDKMLDHVWRANNARNWLLNFSAHFWRSFNWVCKDENWPVRIIDTRHSSGVGYIPRELGPVWHFGYAIRDETLRYKLAIHGHRNELRPNWYEEKWQAWPPVEDCHPTNGRKEDGTGWWNPEPFDRYLLPEILHSHKFFNLERID